MANLGGIDNKAIAGFLIGGTLIGGVVWFANRPAPIPEPTPTAVVSEVREIPTETLTPEEPTPAPAVSRSRPSVKPAPTRPPSPAPVPVAKSEPAPPSPAPAPAPVYRQPEPAPAPPASTSTVRPEPRPEPVASRPAPLPKREPNKVTIPSGTALEVRLGDSLSSETNVAGDTFQGTLDKALVVDGLVIAEKGSKVEGKVARVVQSGRVKGVGEIHLELTNFHSSDGQTVNVSTDSFVRQADASKKDDLKKVGIGAGIGAAIGAIAGGGKGAAIGAAAGGAAGGGVAAATRGKPAEIPVETKMTFRLGSPVTVTEKID